MYVPKKTYEIPDEGPLTAVNIDNSDIGEVEFPNRNNPGTKDKVHMTKLTYAMSQLGSNGEPLQVTARVALSRGKGGKLFKHVRALRYPRPLNPLNDDEWELDQYIGSCVVVDIVHSVKDSGTFANIDSVSPLPKDAPRLSIPKNYVRKGNGSDTDTDFPGDQRKPPISAGVVDVFADVPADAEPERKAKPKGEPFVTGTAPLS